MTQDSSEQSAAYQPVRNPSRRGLTRQLLDAIEAWEDALTDEEREAQQEQAYALLDRLTGVAR